MRFGAVPLDEAEGAILAHAVRLPKGRLPKGARLTAADVARLREAGRTAVVAARLDPADVAEDEAAARIAAALERPGIEATAAATGRANLHATRAGLLLPDRAAVDALNRIDPGITLATLPAFAAVEASRMVATVKIIPLALREATVGDAEQLGRRSEALRLAPFRARPVGLVQTELPSIKPSVLDKTRRALETRLARSRSHLVREGRCAHETEVLAQILREASPGEALTVVFGASAVIDAADVVPAAIRRAGGTVDHLGMPVDPGNLLLLGRIGERLVLGAPGCARSSAENGFDWVLDRLMADLPLGAAELTGMGVGGLLMEIASRPQPREAPADRAGVDVVLLAAGRSSRMGGPNKLLATFNGVPLVRRSAEIALDCGARRVHVVVGHHAEAIREALEGLDVAVIVNPDYADGLSTSLVRGFEAASASAGGVLVMLADQPLLEARHLRALIERFQPTGAGSIVLAADGGRRANPVLLSAIHRDEIRRLQGDVGARSVVAAHPDAVVLVEIGPAASLDVDTPDRVREAGGILAPSSGRG